MECGAPEEGCPGSNVSIISHPLWRADRGFLQTVGVWTGFECFSRIGWVKNKAIIWQKKKKTGKAPRLWNLRLWWRSGAFQTCMENQEVSKKAQMCYFRGGKKDVEKIASFLCHSPSKSPAQSNSCLLIMSHCVSAHDYKRCLRTCTCTHASRRRRRRRSHHPQSSAFNKLKIHKHGTILSPPQENIWRAISGGEQKEPGTQ